MKKLVLKVFTLAALFCGANQAQAQYCTPLFDYGCGVGDQILNAYTQNGITNFSNLNSGCSSGSYTYYSSMTVSEMVGGTFNLTVQAGPSYGQGFKVWIDWNQNGSFLDAGEEVLSSSSSLNPNTVAVTVPAGAVLGTTRMRVRCDYSATPVDPCAIQYYGEVEDYNVDVILPPPSDAGVTAIDTPYVPACILANSVWIKVGNIGTNNLTSADVNWSVNGVAQTTATFTGNVPQLGTAPFFVGNYTFSDGDVLKVWTSNPNGVADSHAANDTLIMTVVGALSGIKTIGGTTPDYATPAAAVTALKNAGVCGPVTFHVRQGTYTGQLDFDNIFGSSSTNTISFMPDPANTAPAIITYQPLTSTTNFTVRFDGGAQYISFENLDIVTQNTSVYNRVLHFGSTHHISIDSCNIVGVTSSSTGSAMATVFNDNSAGVLANDISITNSMISGGSYGLYWYGESTSTREMNNEILNNEITGYYYMGIASYYQQAIDISGNMVSSSGSYSSPYGMYVYYNYDVRVNKNDVQLSATSGGYGIYMYYTNSGFTPANPSEINNNFVSFNGTGTGSPYGIDLYNTSRLDAMFNTVNINMGGASAYPFYVYNSSSTYGNNKLKNNIGVNYTGGYAVYFNGSGSTSGSVDHDYNNWYSTGTNVGYYNGSIAGTIAQWQQLTGASNSIGVNPFFTSSTDLHVLNSGLNAAGTPVTYITDDIDGDVRGPQPDIGADEFTPLALDAGVLSIDTPGVTACSLGPVHITVNNYGLNTITSLTINWTVNGTAQTPASFTGMSLASATDTSLYLGSTTLAPGDVIKIWTDSPNGTSEVAAGSWNDTVSKTVGNYGLSGTYNLGGPGADYYSYAAVVNDLVNFGLCGPVTILVNDSTYTEKVIIDPIGGASALNTVTFRSASGDSSMSILTSAGTSAANYIVNLNGSSFITFENLTLKNTNASYGTVVSMTSGANNNTFRNNVMEGSVTTTTSSNMALVYSPSGSNENDNSFLGNHMIGGSFGFYYYGAASTNPSSGLVIDGNIMENQYYHTVYIYYGTPVVSNNVITHSTPVYTSGSSEIYIGYADGPFKVTGNIMSRNNLTSGYAYPVYLYYSDGSPSDRGLVANNMISVGDTGVSVYAYGIYTYYTTSTDIIHNTVNIEGTSSSSRAIYNYYGGGFRILNNILSTQNGYGFYNTNGYIQEMDNNNFYLGASVTMGYYNATYATFTAWQQGTGLDKNSYTVNPNFVSQSDLHICNDTLNGAGMNLGFAWDVDGDSRSTTPDIGADEFIASTPELGPDTTVCFGTPVLLNMHGSTDGGYTWSTGDTTSTLLTTFPGTYSVTVQSSCGTGSDTIEVIHIQTPVANFSSTGSYLTGVFTNQSVNGNSYTWDFGDGTTSNQSDPTHLFNNSGVHNVTLYVTNECGTDSLTTTITLTVPNVAENGFSGSMSVYPNPTDGMINLALAEVAEGSYTLRVANLQGQVVYESVEQVNGASYNNRLDLSNLSRGVYILSLSGPDGTGSARIVIN